MYSDKVGIISEYTIRFEKNICSGILTFFCPKRESVEKRNDI